MTERTQQPTRPKTTARHFKATDVGAVAKLATGAVHGVLDIAEGVHRSVLSTMGLQGRRANHTPGITGLVYQSIRTITGLVGSGTGSALGALAPLLQRLEQPGTESPERLRLLAVLNGVLGDRLHAQGNPLATAMTLHLGQSAWQPGQPWPMAADAPPPDQAAQSHVLLTIHGLCMNDAQWLWQGHDHGAVLASALGCTRLNLRYNSGLHISDNGEQLAQLLERLVAHWPVPLTRLTIVTHSMGGLVARSAHAAGLKAGHAWPQRLKELVFLGTPHHGSPLERAGHGVDLLLGASRFTAPFVRLGKVRSAGITDLRHGHVLPTDWQAQAKQPRALGRTSDTRVPLPLPEGVRCFAVAATLAAKRSLLAERLTGDGLVPLNSALGMHDDPKHRLHLPKEHQLVVYRTGHLALLSSTAVAKQLVTWLSDPH